MLDRDALTLVLREIASEGLAVGLDRFAYRSIALRHFLPPKVPSPLFAASAGSIGTRFVPPDRPISSLYVALEAETAHREGNQSFYQTVRSAGLDLGRVNPPQEVVMIGVRVRLGALLDVRDGAILGRLETSPDELLSPWKTVTDAPTQRLGGAVFESGSFEGLAYSSAQQAGGSCLIVFPERLRAGSVVEFVSRTDGVPSARLGGPPV